MGPGLLIRGGTVYDGTGAAAERADVLIEAGRITRIGPDLDASGARVIDATGLAVAPGFIDIKTHSDFTLPINPRAESKVRQGVTTEIIGHCGFSAAPCLPDKVALLKDYLSPSAPWLPFRALTFDEYLDTFPATSVNAGMLVGHNTLRLMVMGMDERAPTAAELEAMIALLESGLRAGALGLSTGLFTAPGAYAARDEIHALAHVLKRYNAAYFTHLRDESNRVIEALEEAIDVGATCGVHVQVVHFKCSGVDNWGKVDQALAMIEAARARGVAIDCDAYPYTAGSNPLKNILPQWLQAGGVEAMLERLRERATRERLRTDIAAHGLNNWGRIESWESVRISISPHQSQYAGRTIASLAAERALGRRPEEMAHNHPGWDIRSTAADGSVVKIEVKGRITGADDFVITMNEVLTAKNLGDDYRLALVEVSPDGPVHDRLVYLSRPFDATGTDDFSVKRYVMNWDARWSTGTAPH